MDENINKQQKVNFGYAQITRAEKPPKVNQIFDKVAKNYDLINNIMSLGLHHLWKNLAVDALKISHGGETTHILDLAAGSGDISYIIAKRYQNAVQLTLSDASANMLKIAKDKYKNNPLSQNWSYVETSAEKMPFADNSFDAVIISFGLRNCTDIDAVLLEISRILQPMGIFVCLEFSMPKQKIIKKLYDLYSFTFLPAIGAALIFDASPYRYLAESIRSFLSPAQLQQKISASGFSHPRYNSIEQGIVSLYSAYNLKPLGIMRACTH